MTEQKSDVLFFVVVVVQVPEAFQMLIEKVDRTMKHAIEVEEKIPMEHVTNFDEVLHSANSSLQCTCAL